MSQLSKKLLEENNYLGVVSTLLTGRSKLRKGDGSIFRDKGEKRARENLGSGLHGLLPKLILCFDKLSTNGNVL